jgi:hypothetical protein
MRRGVKSVESRRPNKRRHNVRTKHTGTPNQLSSRRMVAIFITTPQQGTAKNPPGHSNSKDVLEDGVRIAANQRDLGMAVKL